MQQVFISYCSEDGDFTESLSDKIGQAGFLAWKDVELRAGDDWRNKIDQAISDSFVLIAVMTPRSKNSEYVNYEWAFALGAGVTVVPILIGLRESDLHPRLHPLQHLDFTDLDHGRWELLLNTIGELAERHRPFTIHVPWDAPPVIRNAAQALDSLNTGERREAINSLGQMNHTAAREALAEATKHPVQEVRILAAKHLASLQDVRALPGLVEGIQQRHQEITASMLARLGGPAVPDLVECLSCTDSKLREAAVWALGEIGDSRPVPRLLELLQDKNSRGRKEIVEALSKINDIAAVPGLGQTLSDGDRDGRQAVILALGKIGRASAVPFLLQCLQDKDESIRQAAVLELGELGEATAVSGLIDVLINDGSTSIREYAATALGRIRDSRAISALIHAACEGNFSLRDSAFEAVQSIGGIAAIEGLIEVLRNKNESDEDRRRAALALGSLRDAVAVPIVLECLADERADSKMQLGAIEALGMLKDPLAVPRLSDFLRGEPSDVAEAAADALSSIGTPEALLAVKTWPKVKNRGA